MASEYAILFKMASYFFRNRVGSILNLQIHHVNLYVIKLPHSRKVLMKSNIVNHLKTSIKSKLTQLTSRDMIRERSLRLIFLLPIHESVKSACQNWTSRALTRRHIQRSRRSKNSLMFDVFKLFVK